MWKLSKNLLKKFRDQLILLRIFCISFWVHKFIKEKLIIFISTPVHGNLGDQAIVYAQYLLINDIGVGKCIVEITRPNYERLREHLIKIIFPTDIIIIDGGGNIGTLWPQEEEKMRDIIQRFPQNPIFIFPQTAFFSDDAKGQEELKKSQVIYSSHTNLTVFCRDKVTYDIFNEYFPKVKHIFTPDMVLYIDKMFLPTAKRNGILLCLRHDLEKSSQTDLEVRLEAFIENLGFSSRKTSTLYHGTVWKRTRFKILMKKWAEFSSAQLVITDRLHGMIFCAITSTPCIALDNLSHKVRDGYTWIRYLPYIHFVNDEEEIFINKEILCSMSNEASYDRSLLNPYYQLIEEEIKRALQ